MKLLLDTQLVLWVAGHPDRLSVEAREATENLHNELMFSSASLWGAFCYSQPTLWLRNIPAPGWLIFRGPGAAGSLGGAADRPGQLRRMDERAPAVMSEIYRPLNLNQPPLSFVDRRTSELVKYAANAFLATKITFINEIADLCEKVSANVQDVARGIGMDSRIGSKFLHAGPDYGGSCFPKDTLALVKTGQDADLPLRIIETVAAVNEQCKRGMAKKVIAACGGSVRGKTIALLGLAFKPNTDDMRDAPFAPHRDRARGRRRESARP